MTFLGPIRDIKELFNCAGGGTHTKDTFRDQGVHGEFINGLPKSTQKKNYF